MALCLIPMLVAKMMLFPVKSRNKGSCSVSQKKLHPINIIFPLVYLWVGGCREAAAFFVRFPGVHTRLDPRKNDFEK